MKNNRNMKRTTVIILALALIMSSFSAVYGTQANAADKTYIDQVVSETAGYLTKTVREPAFGMIGGEWLILGLSRSNADIPDDYIDTYYKNVEMTLTENKGALTRNKYSEYSRLIIALTALGKDVTNVSGYNLLDKLTDFDSVKKQGINGPIFALIALNGGDYSIPKSAQAVTPVTEELLLDYIFGRELPKGGFCLGGTAADPDITAFVLQALANYKDSNNAAEVIERTLSALSSMQLDNGGFKSSGAENSESIVQSIIALTALGIHPETDTRFVKDGSDGKKRGLVSALLDYRLKDGSFLHIPDGGPDLMATEQAMMALTAYQRFLDKETALFDLSDVNKDGPENPGGPGSEYEYKVLLNGRYLVFDQPPVNIKDRVLVPMRAIFEALNAQIEWDGQTQTVTGTLGERKVILAIGKTTAYVNGKPVTLDVPGMLVNDRTMVPVRFIAESLDAQVIWEEETKTAVINK